MVSLGDFSRIVSAIHAAAITPHHWIEAMEAVRCTFGSTSAAMITADGTSRVINSAYLPPEAERAYRDHYRRVDYVLDAVEHGPVGLIRSGEPLVALAKGTEGFATAERVQFVNALVPHLQQALRSQSHLNDLVHKADDLAEAVDSMRNGVFVVAPGSAVMHLNRIAEDIVAAGDGPWVRSGRLGLKVPSVDAALHRSILEAMGCNESEARCGSSLLCPRIEGRRPYVIHVVPFTSSGPDGDQPRALVIVIDPERQSEPSRDLLSRLYRLTRAEAEIAVRVSRGDGLKPMSEEMSLSLATVKTHLHHVFSKTETHRQAELVRLLLTITP
jgi:DNA-binding CsgD family transcriptional regulator